ncbi:HlyD family efflux transporter periplasmic adaptor subunit [Lacihabitans sp. LS3-19]|uniref:efflux RND transporter periplasmic adaptor subunit n=1 Tax=Lacihabitans sp. LS3-19 TaxID=2487335 RepID=UPI0020CF6650|nr:efflux RND transporter periplasmic adaptor subunit [Lacihabitans sp. LS3-19]MCP9769200.1 HlyD family efflux transporter periplasmic adaptor subunit [Lacihabitans sp. LS3-19]
MKKRSNKIWYILLGVLLALLILFLVAKKQGWIMQEKPTEVELSKVIKGTLVETVSASGKIQPEVEVKISPDVPGEIIGLYVKEGDSVKKGQLLLKIQPENYVSVVDRFKAGVNQSRANAEQTKAAISRAESQLLRAQMEYNRQKKLLAEKVISQSDFETAETNMKIARQDVDAAKSNFEAAKYGINSAEAALKDASENLRKTNIYAPMNGIVSKLAVELGERVVGTSQMTGTEMLRIANLNNMEVRVNVNENDIIRVSKGDTVIVDVDAYSSSNKKFRGIVSQVANTANGAGGSLTGSSSNSTESVTEFEVRIKILPSSYSDLINISEGKKYPFKPGMTATVDIVTSTKPGVLSVPISAVTTRVEGKDKKDKKEEDGMGLGAVAEESEIKKDKPKEIVFVNDKGIAKKREVKTGITDTSAGMIEVVSGLKDGEEIISGPFLEVSKKLNDGDKVALKKAKEVKK